MSSDEAEDYGSDVDDEEEVTRNVKTNVKRKTSTSTVKNANKKAKMSFIDDAAELSGSDIDSEDDEEEEEDDDNQDYIRDGFVVDEDEEEKERKIKKKLAKRGDLVDSDEDEDDDEEDEDEDEDSYDDDSDSNGNETRSARIKTEATSSDVTLGKKKKKKKKRIRKLDAQLDEDDLLLIRESKGEDVSYEEARRREAAEEALKRKEEAERKRRTVVAQTEKELRKGLFNEDDDFEEESSKGTKQKEAYLSKSQQQQKQKQQQQRHKQSRAEDEFDEDALDDFIEDDIGDDVEDDYGTTGMRRRRRNHGWGYDDDDDLDYGGAARGGRISEAQWNEANEIFGIDYANVIGGIGGEGEEHDAEWSSKKHRYREQGVGVDMAGESEEEEEEEEEGSEGEDLFGSDEDVPSRREAAKQRRLAREKQKQQRNQQRLERNAEKRRALLRRAYEPIVLIENFCTPMDDEIRKKDVPERFQIMSSSSRMSDFDTVEEDADALEESSMWIMAKIPEIATEFFSTTSASDKEKNINAMQTDEIELLKHQKDILESIQCAVKYMKQEKLEPEFIRMYRQDYVTSKAVREHLYDVMDQNIEWNKVQHLRVKAENLLTNFASTASKYQVSTTTLQESSNTTEADEALNIARERLNDAVRQEARASEELQRFQQENQTHLEDDNSDADDLFGESDEDGVKEEKKKQLKIFEERLEAVQALVQERAEKVASLSLSSTGSADNQNNSYSDSLPTIIMNKLCIKELWNEGEYRQYLSTLTEERQVADVTDYLQLIQEGNDSILVEAKILNDSNLKQRSKRHDRDYYRTFVSKGMRSIAYRFMLSPLRAGIKLDEQGPSSLGDFDFQRRLVNEGDEASPSNTALWVCPLVEKEPDSFTAELISSGELVILANKAPDSDLRAADPLHGCRYVAAMELAYEPRIRKHLRSLYRKLAVLTTTPTKMGLATIDTFHEHFGLHLIHEKPVREHFADPDLLQQPGISEAQRKGIEEGLRKKEKESCLQFLRALKAHSAGFVKLKVHLPAGNKDDINWYKTDYHQHVSSSDLSAFMDALEPLFSSIENGGFTTADNLWRVERNKVIKQALTSFLFPLFEEELIKDMAAAAIKFGVAEAGNALRAMAFEGPYRPTHLLGENRFLVPTGELPFVGVSVALDPREATYFAAVSAKGELKNSLAIPPGKQITDADVREKIIGFLIGARPAAVLVGTSGGLSSRLFNRKLSEILTEATEKWNNRLVQGEDEEEEEYEARRRSFEERYGLSQLDEEPEDELWKCNVDLIDDDIAQLFGRSVRGSKEFPDAAINLKCAIATARHAQDPLSGLCYAWSVASDSGNFGVEMLSLNVHPLQRHVPRTSLLRAYERALCRAVAEVGVDINAACTFDHKHGVLQFVPGLGPRKAANLKQNVSRGGGSVPSRKYLLLKRFIGPLVYNNCIAFLRIRDCEQLSLKHINPLDDTRLHPDVYIRNTWAKKIAVDALEEHIAGIEEEEMEEVYIRAVRDVMLDSRNQVKALFNATKKQWENMYGPTFSIAGWDPHNLPAEAWQDKVEELDLDAFAEMIENSGVGKWLSHLSMIKWEFRFPFEDPRKPMEQLRGEKLFQLLTGENDWTLRPGKEVTGKVVKNTDFGSRVRLEGDIPGFIALRNMADERVEAAEDFLSEGSVITAVVIEVKKDHISVDLSLRLDDFRKPSVSWERPKALPPLDDFFDASAAERLESSRSKEREAHLDAIQAALQKKKEANIIGQSVKKAEVNVKRSAVVTRRACDHPAFRNGSNSEVNYELLSGGITSAGEALLRPSSKDCDTLALHWVVRPGVIKIIEVIEDNKDTDASIGNILKIKNEEYGSIDELLGRYVAPLNDRVEEICHHRKFADLSEADVDEKLKALKKKIPTSVHYFLCWSEKYPGYASLRYIIQNTPRDHPISLSPDGFQWGKKTYKRVEDLINDFKLNPSGQVAVEFVSKPSAPPAANAAKPSRWGARPAPPPFPPPPPPPAIGWGTSAAAPPTTGWGVRST